MFDIMVGSQFFSCSLKRATQN